MEKVTTERLSIRRMTTSDLPDLLAYQTHLETLTYLPNEAYSQEDAVAFLARQAALTISDANFEGYVAFAIERIDDRRMIGEVGIYLKPAPRNEGDMGWLLHPDYQRQGYATEAARALLAYAFDERGLRRVTSGCDARNTASFRLMERLGMRREAHFRQSQWTKGVWHDEYAYALLRGEYDLMR